MKKDFDNWNGLKKGINERTDIQTLFFREQEVWWASLGLNVGDEEDGKGSRKQRPILVLRKFNARIMWAIPLTTKIKDNPYYVPIISPDMIPRCAMISQLRLMDIRRLNIKMFYLDNDSFATIRKTVRDLIP